MVSVTNPMAKESFSVVANERIVIDEPVRETVEAIAVDEEHAGALLVLVSLLRNKPSTLQADSSCSIFGEAEAMPSQILLKRIIFK